MLTLSLYRGTAAGKHARPITTYGHTSRPVHRCFNHHRGSHAGVRVCNSPLPQYSGQWKHSHHGTGTLQRRSGVIPKYCPSNGHTPFTRVDRTLLATSTKKTHPANQGWIVHRFCRAAAGKGQTNDASKL